MTLRETVDYYVDLLVLQYRGLPRARATIAIYVKQALGDMLAEQLGTAFDLDSAVGPQLDVLGKYVGVPRNIGTPVARPYFSFSSSDGTIRPNGYNSALDPSVNAQAIFYSALFLGTENTDLSDVAYLLILRLKIILNSNDGTLASIQAFLKEFFPGVVELTDNKDMTLTYVLSTRTPVSSTVLQGYLPKPMGVGINFVFLSGTVATPTSKTLVVPHGDHGLHTVTSDPVTVLPANGVGPYTFNWELVSGSELIQPTGDVTSAIQHFFMQGVADVTRSAVYRCAITDSREIVGYSNDLTVTLAIQEAP